MRSSFLRGTCVGLMLIGLVACGPSKPGQEVVARWIAEPSDRLFDLGAVAGSFGANTWTFTRPDEARRWRPTAESELQVIDGALVAPAERSKAGARIFREVDFLAESVDVIEIEARGLTTGRLRLYWGGAGQKFAQERAVVYDVAASEDWSTYRFEPAPHALWKGRIYALRIDIPGELGRAIEVRRVATRPGKDFEAEMLASMVAGNWKLDLANDVRNVVLTPPGVPRSWQLEEPVGGRLRFALGKSPGRGADVSFRVSGKADDGSPEVLFEASHDAGTPWMDVEIELPSDVGELTFETVAGPDYDLEAGIPAWAHPEILAPADAVRPPNVVLISIDTLRADRVGVYGYDAPTTPNIDAWATRRGVIFRRAVATAPWTLPSHVSMLSGLDALSHGANHERPASNELTLLPETLRAAGYKTLAVTGGGWLHPNQGLSQGFDRFRYWGQAFGDSNEIGSGIEQALDILDAHADEPFFLFFHTYEAHDPYHPRLPYAQRCLEGEVTAERAAQVPRYGATRAPQVAEEGFALNWLMRKWPMGASADAGEPVADDELPLVSCLYDSGIAHVDAQIGRLFERLQTLGIEDETLVVLTSDHGESLGEYGFVKHAYLLDTNLMVPLIIAWPGAQHGGSKVATQVSSVDIVPTVLEALGMRTGADMDGRSLASLAAGESPTATREAWSYSGFSNVGLSLRVNDRFKYVFNNTAWQPLLGREELYDLRTDGDERNNLSTTTIPELERLRQRTQQHLEEGAQGVRVSFENPACDRLHGELNGLSVHISRVKSTGLPSGALSWLGGRRAAFEVARGESFSVLLEAPQQSLVLRGGLEGCKGEQRTFDRAVELAGLGDEPWRFGLVDGSWTDDAEDAVVAIEVQRVGRSAVAQETEEIDPALIKQLESLGYLDG